MDRQCHPYAGARRLINRNVVGACLALAGLVIMSFAALILVTSLNSPVFGIKLEEGYFPSDSAQVVRAGRTGVIAATALIVVSTRLSACAVAVRPHTVVLVLAAITLLGVLPFLLLLLFGYGLVF